MGLERIARPRVERGFLFLWAVLIILAGALSWVAALSFTTILVLLVVVSLVHVISHWVMAA